MYTIYGKPDCPYCEQAKWLAEMTKVEFNYIDMAGNQEQIDDIKERSGMRTVPVIYNDETLVGGFTEFYAKVTSN